MRKTIASIVGARPQFIKATPVSRTLTSGIRGSLGPNIVHYNNGRAEVFFIKFPQGTLNF
jgi:hypothetical protein